MSPPLTLTMARIGRLGAGAEVDQAVYAAVRALLLAAIGLGVNQGHGPPLELVLVAPGEVAGAVQVLGGAVHVEGDAGEGVLEAALDEADGEVGDVYADPAAAELLGGVGCRPAAAEGIEDEVAGVAAGQEDAFKEGERLLGGVAQAFLGLGTNGRDVVP